MFPLFILDPHFAKPEKIGALRYRFMLQTIACVLRMTLVGEPSLPSIPSTYHARIHPPLQQRPGREPPQDRLPALCGQGHARGGPAPPVGRVARHPPDLRVRHGALREAVRAWMCGGCLVVCMRKQAGWMGRALSSLSDPTTTIHRTTNKQAGPRHLPAGAGRRGASFHEPEPHPARPRGLSGQAQGRAAPHRVPELHQALPLHGRGRAGGFAGFVLWRV